MGTSTAVEFKEYFSDLRRHKIPFRYSGTECDERITMAFQRDRVEDRKVWLTEYMEELARRKREGEPELTLYDREQISFISYKDFIDKGTLLGPSETEMSGEFSINQRRESIFLLRRKLTIF